MLFSTDMYYRHEKVALKNHNELYYLILLYSIFEGKMLCCIFENTEIVEILFYHY